MNPTLEAQIDWLDTTALGDVLRDSDMAHIKAILSTLRAVEAAEKELPELQYNGYVDLLEHTPKKVREYIDALRAYAVAQKVREHD